MSGETETTEVAGSDVSADPATSVTETEATEVTASETIDEPAIVNDASASPSSAESETQSPEKPKAVAKPKAHAKPKAEPAKQKAPESVDHGKAGGGFDSPFVKPAAAPTMVERLDSMEARLSALEAK